MRQNYILSYDNLRTSEGIIWPGLSGLVTGVAAGADLAGFFNFSPRPLVISSMRLRWVTKTVFTVAQSLAFRVNKVYDATQGHSIGGKPIAAHYKHQGGVSGTELGGRIPVEELWGYIASVGAITGALYVNEDPDEPEMYAVGAGNTAPGVFDDWIPVDGLPLVLPQNTGMVVNNDIAMGAGGAGSLFLGIDGYRFAA